MKQKKFILRSQLQPPVYDGEVFSEVSMCEPGQSLTAAEILKNVRFTGRTGLFDSAPGAVYDEEGILEDYANLDKTEMVDVSERISARLSEYEERMKNQKKPQRKEASDAPPNEGGVALSEQASEGAETK